MPAQRERAMTVTRFGLARRRPQKEAPLPLWAIALIGGLQNGVLLGGLAWLGLRAGDTVGLGAPMLRAFVEGKPRPQVTARDVGAVVLVGIGIGACVAALDLFVLFPMLPAPKSPFTAPGGWLGLLASLYGAINEEVLLRLFFTSVLAWLLSLPARRRGARAPAWSIATAVVLAAFLFGLGHLPTASGMWELTPFVMFRVVLLNMMLGVPFGLLYWRRGLEHAMAAHFLADLVLHVFTPLLQGNA